MNSECNRIVLGQRDARNNESRKLRNTIEITLTRPGFNNRRSVQCIGSRSKVDFLENYMHALWERQRNKIAYIGDRAARLEAYFEIWYTALETLKSGSTETLLAVCASLKPRSVKSGKKSRCNLAITIRRKTPDSIITLLIFLWVQLSPFVRKTFWRFFLM